MISPREDLYENINVFLSEIDHEYPSSPPLSPKMLHKAQPQQVQDEFVFNLFSQAAEFLKQDSTSISRSKLNDALLQYASKKVDDEHDEHDQHDQHKYDFRTPSTKRSKTVQANKLSPTSSPLLTPELRGKLSHVLSQEHHQLRPRLPRKIVFSQSPFGDNEAHPKNAAQSHYEPQEHMEFTLHTYGNEAGVCGAGSSSRAQDYILDENTCEHSIYDLLKRGSCEPCDQDQPRPILPSTLTGPFSTRVQSTVQS